MWFGVFEYCIPKKWRTYRGGESPASKSYMWAKPKVSVFKNGQFRDPFFLRKILFFWKKQKLFSPLNDNFVLFFEKIFFPFFSNFFFCGHFFCFSDTFFGGIIFGKNKFSFKGKNIWDFFFKNISPQKKCPKNKKSVYKKNNSKKMEKIFFQKKHKVVVFKRANIFFCFFQKKGL